jgi:hypothetical protein
MIRITLSVIFLVASTAFVAYKQHYDTKKNTSFIRGEQLEYKVSFLGITIGKGITTVAAKSYNINSRPCFKIDAFGETSGISWIYRVNDNWGAYIDTASFVTHVAYRKLRENNYRKDELVDFDHVKRKARVKVMNKETGVFEVVNDYDIPDQATDLVGGFIQMRFFDFKKIKVGDTVAISGFFEDASYTLNIIYRGRETISTSVGKIPCHLMVPIMPDNKLFNGENSISVWLSDDANKIPVKIQARMFIGHTGLELISFRGLRNQIRIVQ